MTNETTNVPRVIKRTELRVPYSSGELAYIHPAFGPSTYQEVGKRILEQGLLVPTGDYIAPLVHTAYCNKEAQKEKEFKDIQDIMKTRWLWVFNRNLWTDQGVYIYQDPKAKGISKPLIVNELKKMLKDGKEIKGTEIRVSKDGLVRFAPKCSYRLGKHSPESLAKDGFMIASYNQRGAELLGEVSSTFRNKPYIYGADLKESQTPELRVSTLGSRCVDVRLNVGGGFGDFDYGYGFGVLVSGEARAQNI